MTTKTKNKPPSIWLLVALMLFIGIGVYIFAEKPVEAIPEPYNGSLILIGGNSVMAVTIPAKLEPTPLTSLIDDIIWCESRGDPSVCNQQYGCKAGMGLFQLIPSTVKYCEEKLGRDIDPFNENDNMACGMWLLKNEGTDHWGTADTDWGSYWCWSGK